MIDLALYEYDLISCSTSFRSFLNRHQYKNFFESRRDGKVQRCQLYIRAFTGTGRASYAFVGMSNTKVLLQSWETKELRGVRKK